MRMIYWSRLLIYLFLVAVGLGLIFLVSKYSNSTLPTFHEVYLLDVKASKFNHQQFENSFSNYDLDYDFIEADDISLNYKQKALLIKNGEIWSTNQKAGLVIAPRAKISYGILILKCQTLYLKRYKFDKQGNYTDVYYYEIYSRQIDGKYQLVRSGRANQ